MQNQKPSSVLIALEGVKAKKTDCYNITAASQIQDILKPGSACTASGKYGAINIWIDDAGDVHVQSMTYGIPIETNIYKTMPDVIIWADRWLEIIGVLSMDVREAIQHIESLYSPDSQYIQTSVIGRQLMDDYVGNTVGYRNWRTLSDEQLVQLAKANIRRHESE